MLASFFFFFFPVKEILQISTLQTFEANRASCKDFLPRAACRITILEFNLVQGYTELLSVHCDLGNIFF